MSEPPRGSFGYGAYGGGGYGGPSPMVTAPDSSGSQSIGLGKHPWQIKSAKNMDEEVKDFLQSWGRVAAPLPPHLLEYVKTHNLFYQGGPDRSSIVMLPGLSAYEDALVRQAMKKQYDNGRAAKFRYQEEADEAKKNRVGDVQLGLRALGIAQHVAPGFTASVLGTSAPAMALSGAAGLAFTGMVAANVIAVVVGAVGKGLDLWEKEKKSRRWMRVTILTAESPALCRRAALQVAYGMYRPLIVDLDAITESVDRDVRERLRDDPSPMTESERWNLRYRYTQAAELAFQLRQRPPRDSRDSWGTAPRDMGEVAEDVLDYWTLPNKDEPIDILIFGEVWKHGQSIELFPQTAWDTDRTLNVAVTRTYAVDGAPPPPTAAPRDVDPMQAAYGILDIRTPVRTPKTGEPKNSTALESILVAGVRQLARVTGEEQQKRVMDETLRQYTAQRQSEDRPMWEAVRKAFEVSDRAREVVEKKTGLGNFLGFMATGKKADWTGSGSGAHPSTDTRDSLMYGGMPARRPDESPGAYAARLDSLLLRTGAPAPAPSLPPPSFYPPTPSPSAPPTRDPWSEAGEFGAFMDARGGGGGIRQRPGAASGWYGGAPASGYGGW